LGKSIKYIIFRLSDDFKEIVVEDASSDDNYDAFREKLVNAKTKNKMGKEGKGPRYAVYVGSHASIEDLPTDRMCRTSTTTWLPARVQGKKRTIYRFPIVINTYAEARSHSSHGLQMMLASRLDL
jgi:hypothetical protein